MAADRYIRMVAATIIASGLVMMAPTARAESENDGYASRTGVSVRGGSEGALPGAGSGVHARQARKRAVRITPLPPARPQQPEENIAVASQPLQPPQTLQPVLQEDFPARVDAPLALPAHVAPADMTVARPLAVMTATVMTRGPESGLLPGNLLYNPPPDARRFAMASTSASTSMSPPVDAPALQAGIPATDVPATSVPATQAVARLQVTPAPQTMPQPLPVQPVSAQPAQAEPVPESATVAARPLPPRRPKVLASLPVPAEQAQTASGGRFAAYGREPQRQASAPLAGEGDSKPGFFERLFSAPPTRLAEAALGEDTARPRGKSRLNHIIGDNPDGATRLRPLIEKHAAENGLPFKFADAVVRIESRYNPRARNGPYIGLMQIHPATARSLGYGGDATGLYDPDTNLRYGVKYLAMAYRLAGGDTCGTVMRYQGGHRSVTMTAANRTYCNKVKMIFAENLR